ncbi:alpha-ketoglutarate-dependent dioxygenase alkB 6-like protein [Dinothrombium tinctorium]|uniref:Alpha-ketoglutarate-dependent dioxygenase alkB 6-like protein n=1 Tax=Dinothrombium tinctorium TaxID=1965070 RepID=A0A3S3SK48_9ACAR|nr:alpha-ketoglutarate-dependent dioxygenase alkB 6-like protein [Dinothrombium tinctorium]
MHRFDRSTLEEKFQIAIDDEKLIPATIFYLPEFIDKEQEEYLLRSVENSPKPKWTYLSNRRLQNWGGLPHRRGMIAEPLPIWLKIYCDKVSQLGVFDDKTPNHVLVNEYLPKQGIMPHEDGSLFYPTVATINLGSHTVLNFYKKNQHEATVIEPDYIEGSERCDRGVLRSKVFSLLLQPRSLLILKNDAYKDYMHGIEEVAEDVINDQMVNLHLVSGAKSGDKLIRGTRVSLTIRVLTM